MSAPIEVVLGSASPARLAVLRRAGLDPRVLVSGIDEDALLTELADTEPAEVVSRLAAAKADAVVAEVLAQRAHQPAPLTDTVVLSCDSMLLHGGELTGKPHTVDAAAAQWRRLRGSDAQLLTGHCAVRVSELGHTAAATDTASTVIRFGDVSDAEIDAYVATGEPLEVAGAFTLDGLGGWFIDAIDGDPSSVIGIGLPTVRRLLGHLGVDITDLWT
ncbi:MAG: Maf family nucleotide pyrophosphatase [Gordonia sp. (in: high G+C Gram-positive bacteria)]